MKDLLNWTQFFANIATVFGLLGIIFLFVQHYHNKDLRNLQLMHRCIDIFRNWFQNNQVVDYSYLELLNEELFYFQKGLIQKKVAIEWIEGILDFVVINGNNHEVLNGYSNQTAIDRMKDWSKRKMFYARVNYFVNPQLENNIVIPGIEEKNHAKKKRELAQELYKQIKKYPY